MPIGLLIGLCVGLLIAATYVGHCNSGNDNRIEIEIARGNARVVAVYIQLASLAALIGTLIELFAR